MLVFSLLTTWQIIRFVRPETIVNYFLPAIRSYLVCHPSFAAVSSAGGELGYSNNTLEPQQAVALETVKSEAFRPVDKQILGSNNITIDKSKPGMNVDLEVFDAAQSFSMSMLGNVASFRGIVKWFAGWYANCLLDV